MPPSSPRHPRIHPLRHLAPGAPLGGLRPAPGRVIEGIPTTGERRTGRAGSPAVLREVSVTNARSRDDVIQQDVADLHKLGYAQELFRSMGGFSNFAISFS